MRLEIDPGLEDGVANRRALSGYLHGTRVCALPVCVHGDIDAKAERDVVISQAGLTDTPAKNIGDNFRCPARAPAEEERVVTVV